MFNRLVLMFDSFQFETSFACLFVIGPDTFLNYMNKNAFVSKKSGVRL